MHQIELLKSHTHANEVYQPGSVIAVDESTARWLIERGVGRATSQTPRDTEGATAEVSVTRHQRKAEE
jgi:hypothetical protein